MGNYTNEELLKLIEEIDSTDIPDNTNFWMVRSQGGKYFEEFIKSGYVALGWNNVTPELIEKGNQNEDIRKHIKEDIAEKYGSGQPGHVFNRCDNFINEINIGDYVIIPGVNSDVIAFAIITSDCYIEKDIDLSEAEYDAHAEAGFDDILEGLECPFSKRRNIDVLKTIEKKDISPMIYKATTSYQSLNNITSYGVDILSAIYKFYSYKGNMYLNFNVKKASNIKAIDYSGFIHSTTSLMSHYNNEEIFVKSNVNSPGIITLIKSSGTEILNLLNANTFPLLIIFSIAFGGNVGPIKINSIYSMWRDHKDHELKEREMDLKEMLDKASVAKTEAETAKILYELEKSKKEDKKLDTAIATMIDTAGNLEIINPDNENQSPSEEKTDN